VTSGHREGLMLESEELAGGLRRRKETVDAHVATLQADFAAEETASAQIG
jgi:hypothetical protein